MHARGMTPLSFYKEEYAAVEDGYVTTLRPAGSCNDRRSEGYEPISRPTMDYKAALLRVVLTLLAGVAVAGATGLLNRVLAWERPWLALWAALGVWGLILIWRHNRILIWFVRIYQARAREETRKRCLFYPSCSAYMILAIEKYGALRGVPKGIGRLLRCHAPNGGVDYP